MIQSCMCGAHRGYRHCWDCPYPLFLGSDEEQEQWMAARDQLREADRRERTRPEVVQAALDAWHDDR
jgi:hypothetical protein